jgi:hypothetical protein
MSIVVTFEHYVPPARFDSIAWEEARIEEAATEDGDYTQIDSAALLPVDADPTDPASRSFTTNLGTADDYWYRIVFADGFGGTTTPTFPIQNQASSIPQDVTPFAEASELATILQVNATSNSDALDRVLHAAAGEIVSETGRNDFSGWELQLVAQVNLARAEELWKQMKVPWGVIGAESEFGATRIARDTFERHALALAPLKSEWGVA